MGLMVAAYGTSRALGRRDRELLSRRRQRAETRLSYERARNSRLALAGFAALATLLAVGIHTNWGPASVTIHLKPLDAETRRLVETRIGHVLFSSLDGVICRELQFNNDTGRFTNGKLIRCDDAGEPDAPRASSSATAAEPQDRTLAIRDGFRNR
jgi:hypothetical protein